MAVSLSSSSSSGGARGRGVEKPRGSVRVEHRRAASADSLFRDIYDDSEDEDNDEGYADPVHDDLYARKMGLRPQSANAAAAGVSHDKFLPKFWTPEEDVHVQRIRMGSSRRPWYRKMQGFRCVRGRGSNTHTPA